VTVFLHLVRLRYSHIRFALARRRLRLHRVITALQFLPQLPESGVVGLPRLLHVGHLIRNIGGRCFLRCFRGCASARALRPLTWLGSTRNAACNLLQQDECSVNGGLILNHLRPVLAWPLILTTQPASLRLGKRGRQTGAPPALDDSSSELGEMRVRLGTARQFRKDLLRSSVSWLFESLREFNSSRISCNRRCRRMLSEPKVPRTPFIVRGTNR
jgi:hypothetical protein